MSAPQDVEVAAALRLLLRRRQGRRRREDEGAARRQGREPRRDDAARAARCRPASRSRPRSARYYYEHGGSLPARRSTPQVDDGARARREASWAERFGDPTNPLLVSVRSGARALDAGHDGHGPEPRPQRRRPSRASIARPGNARFALRLATAASCRCTATSCSASSPTTRFEDDPFEARSKKRSARRQARHRARPPTTCASSSREFKALVTSADRRRLPAATRTSSSGARSAPSSARGRTRARSPTASSTTSPTSWGTAVNVQAMVFGNLGDDCATGVAFTRDPSTGEQRASTASTSSNAQGEDVVAGIRTPQPINASCDATTTPTLEARCRGLQRARRDLPEAREALPRHAGHRVHDRARQALHAADAQRQAHRRRRGAIAVEMVQREADRPRRPRSLRVDAGAARPAAASRASIRRRDEDS